MLATCACQDRCNREIQHALESGAPPHPASPPSQSVQDRLMGALTCKPPASEAEALKLVQESKGDLTEGWVGLCSSSPC